MIYLLHSTRPNCNAGFNFGSVLLVLKNKKALFNLACEEIANPGEFINSRSTIDEIVDALPYCEYERVFAEDKKRFEKEFGEGKVIELDY